MLREVDLPSDVNCDLSLAIVVQHSPSSFMPLPTLYWSSKGPSCHSVRMQYACMRMTTINPHAPMWYISTERGDKFAYIFKSAHMSVRLSRHRVSSADPLLLFFTIAKVFMQHENSVGYLPLPILK